MGESRPSTGTMMKPLLWRRPEILMLLSRASDVMSMKNSRTKEICAGIRASGPMKRLGFTLLEIIVTVAMVGTLSGIAYPLYTEYMEKARIAAACADIGNISLKIASYFAENLKYPASLNEVGCATLLDPWGSPYRYLNIQTAQGKGDMRKDHFLVPINTDCDLYSMGKDGKSSPPLNSKAGRDDVIRANDGAYIGPASDF
jgi:general secretion pathway protein G